MSTDLSRLTSIRHYGTPGFAEAIRTLMPRGSIWQMLSTPFQFHPAGIAPRETFGAPTVSHV